MEARSWVSVGLGAVLVGLVWVGGFFAVCRAPSFLLPSLDRGLPVFGTGHPFMQHCRPARFSPSLLRVPVVPALPGLGLWWDLGFWFGLFAGFWVWFLAGRWRLPRILESFYCCSQ